MSVYQVEDYYLSVDKSEIDFESKYEIEKYISDNHGDDYNFDGDYLTVDGFDSEGAAEELESQLKERFPA